MNEFYATNLRARVRDLDDVFRRAMAAGHGPSAEKAWHDLLDVVETAISEALHAQIEADAYEAKVLLYEPRRTDRPPAPPIAGHTYVFTGQYPWVCMAKEHRKLVHVNAGLGCGYQQEHYVPDKKTVCGKKVSYPVNDRFTAPSWPRLHELCPECTKLIASLGLLRQSEDDACSQRRL